MGSNLKAKFFYGFVYGENEDENELTNEQKEDWISSLKLAVAEGLAYPDTKDYDSQEWEDYRKIARDLDKKYGIAEGFGGYDDNITRFLAIEKTLVVSEWDEVCHPTILTVDPEWDNRLKAYCDKLGLPYKTPQWCLISLYF